MAQPELWEQTLADVYTAASVIAASKLIGMMATIQAIDEALAQGQVEKARARCHAVLVEAPDVNEQHVLAQLVQTLGSLRSHLRDELDIAGTQMLQKIEELCKALT